MKLFTPILGGFAGLMAILAFIFYFINSGQDNRGTSVGFFVGTAVVFSLFAFISTFFNKETPISSQAKVNANVRKIALIIVVPVVLFIIILYLLAWWLGKGLTF
jgi:hypothetical protein